MEHTESQQQTEDNQHTHSTVLERVSAESGLSVLAGNVRACALAEPASLAGLETRSQQ